MLADNDCLSWPSGIDELFPRHPQPLVSKKAADVLQSHLIIGFEAALNQGMQPSEALALVLSWASSEVARICLERTGGAAQAPWEAPPRKAG